MTDLKDILLEKNIEFKNTNNPLEILVKCTSGLHVDTNPSLSFNLEKNIFRCFSCGFEGGLNKFLNSIGVSNKIHIESKQRYKIIKLQRKLHSLKNIDNLKIPKSSIPIAWDFKDISLPTLREFNAFTTSEYNLEEYICIPVYLFNRLKFIDARLRHSDYSIKSKYNRQPSGISVKDIMFPVDKIDKINHVILVEGMFDMLKLWEYGIRNCLTIFGVNNFGKEKIDLLNKIGINRVTIMMDGDPAGRMGADKIQYLLEKNDILTYKIQLPNGEDPGTLSKQYLYQLLESRL